MYFLSIGCQTEVEIKRPDISFFYGSNQLTFHFWRGANAIWFPFWRGAIASQLILLRLHQCSVLIISEQIEIRKSITKIPSSLSVPASVIRRPLLLNCYRHHHNHPHPNHLVKAHMLDEELNHCDARAPSLLGTVCVFTIRSPFGSFSWTPLLSLASQIPLVLFIESLAT